MTKTDNFEIKLINTVKEFKMFQQNDRVLVGLSGGKDSVALLYALNKLSDYFGISLVAFHLNHGIRGEEADRDMLFAQNFCRKISVPFFSLCVDVPSQLSQTSRGLEALARDVRYKELQRVAADNQCNKIATAHTASDNSETMLLTMMRNSYAKGIPPIRDNIVRPLIYHSTAEVLEYCKSNFLEFVTDSTNSDNHYTRNFLRNNVLKEIYTLSPSFDVATTNFANIQRANVALTEYVADRYMEENKEPLSLNTLHPLAENQAFYNVLYSIVCRCLEISLNYSQFDSIVNLLLAGHHGDKVSIEGGQYVLRDYNVLKLSSNVEETGDYEFTVKYGENIIPDSKLSLWVETIADYNERNNKIPLCPLKINKLSKNNLIKYNIINNTLVARSRKQGDSYICRGHTRSIKKFLIDEKIPTSLRSQLPVVCDSEGIIWFPGLGVADRIKAFDGDSDCISLSVEFKNNDF